LIYILTDDGFEVFRSRDRFGVFLFGFSYKYPSIESEFSNDRCVQL